MYKPLHCILRGSLGWFSQDHETILCSKDRIRIDVIFYIAIVDVSTAEWFSWSYRSATTHWPVLGDGN